MIAVGITSCNDMDVVPTDSASSGNWYSNIDQIRWSLNDGYRVTFWKTDDESWTDNWTQRTSVSEIVSGSVTSSFGSAKTNWAHLYKAITRSNILIREIPLATYLAEEVRNKLVAEAYFMRASYYSYLVTHFGDVPFLLDEITIDESFEVERTDKNVILEQIYKDYDFAAEWLPAEYGANEKRYASSGAALALKARVALYMGDYAISADASKACMNLGVYELHDSYGEYFLPETKNSKETIFAIPRNSDLDDYLGKNYPQKATLPRNRDGWGAYNPSWELLAAYTCTDGLPIDESPLFESTNPFKNRDPRLMETIIPFGSLKDGDGLVPESGYRFLDREYNPHPDAKKILNYAIGTQVKNNDTKSVAQYASFNGLLWKKGVNEKWTEFLADPDNVIIRYADVLLMYAEANIELGSSHIDASVLEAINKVRARAYGVDVADVANYPAVISTNQDELRLIVRNERRVEFANEGLRYMDLIRWRLAEKALVGNIYGLLDVNVKASGAATGPLVDEVTSKGLWFWGLKPEIDDETGLPDFTNLHDAACVK